MIAAFFPAASQVARQPLLECGAELSSFVLWGHRLAVASWQFQTIATDWAPCLRDPEEGGSPPTRSESAWVSSWAEALELLAQRPWESLIPGAVHAEFADEVLAAVMRRLAGQEDERARRLRERWTLACSARSFAAVD
jgi:hypothetical protein